MYVEEETRPLFCCGHYGNGYQKISEEMSLCSHNRVYAFIFSICQGAAGPDVDVGTGQRPRQTSWQLIRTNPPEKSCFTPFTSVPSGRTSPNELSCDFFQTQSKKCCLKGNNRDPKNLCIAKVLLLYLFRLKLVCLKNYQTILVYISHVKYYPADPLWSLIVWYWRSWMLINCDVRCVRYDVYRYIQ